jgi:hypothetical protein
VTQRKLCNSDVCVIGVEIASFFRDKQCIFSCITQALINTSRLINKNLFCYVPVGTELIPHVHKDKKEIIITEGLSNDHFKYVDFPRLNTGNSLAARLMLLFYLSNL